VKEWNIGLNEYPLFADLVEEILSREMTGHDENCEQPGNK
jgi:hypothetical protein